MFVQPLLQWKSKKYYIFWMCVCSLSYPARNAHAPYSHLCPARLYNIFPHYLIQGTIFGGRGGGGWEGVKVLNVKWVFWFYQRLSSETFLILRKNMIINIYMSSCKVPLLFLCDFNETGIFSIYFRKIIKYKISWRSAQWGGRIVPWGRTDMSKLIVAFGNYANAPKTPV